MLIIHISRKDASATAKGFRPCGRLIAEHSSDEIFRSFLLEIFNWASFVKQSIFGSTFGVVSSPISMYIDQFSYEHGWSQWADGKWIQLMGKTYLKHYFAIGKYHYGATFLSLHSEVLLCRSSLGSSIQVSYFYLNKFRLSDIWKQIYQTFPYFRFIFLNKTIYGLSVVHANFQEITIRAFVV